MSHDDFGKALLAIYDTTTSPEHWPQALDAFAHGIGSAGAILVALDRVGLPFEIQQATSNFGRDAVQHYFENFGHYDEPIMSTRLAQTPPLQLLRDCDVWGDMTKLEDRPDYKYLREHFRIYRRGGVRLSQNKGWMDLLALQFAQDWPDVPVALQDRLDTLLPHLAKAVELNRTFSLLRRRYHAALSALDHVTIGMCVVLLSGSIIVANREARRIHDLDDGFVMASDGRWRALQTETTWALSKAIRSVASTAEGEGAEREVLLFAERKSGKRPFMIEVAPLRDSLGELERDLSGAILMIVDPESQRDIAITRMAQLFALTDAEAAVCRHMISGLSAAEIAEVRGVAEATVRTQFKGIYAKTGVHRRAELLRLAITIDPPIGRN